MKLILSDALSTAKPAKRRLICPDPIVRYILKIPSRKLAEVKNLAQWYRTNLNVKVSAAFLIREAIDQFIVREKRVADQARRGRFHAKVRNNNNDTQ